MEVFKFEVTSELAGDRIDKFITSQQEDWSRTQVQQWIKDKRVKVNGNVVKSNYKVSDLDQVEVSVPEPEVLEVEAENIPLDIVFEDEDVIVVNKPRGMVVHPAPGHYSGTLVNALMYHCKDLSGINGVIRPGIVHRIDKDTSGLLMVAKNDQAHESLVSQLKAKTTKRVYQAIVHGVISHQTGTIDAPIGRDKKERQSMTVTNENSREAVTHFTVLDRFTNYTYVQCELETGRTHQIRVHMKYIGYPLAGDPKYGPKKTLDIDGQALHAAVLGFEHPKTKEWVEFEAPLPTEMEKLLEHLRIIG
ncbi:RNA pseudouridine synthase [Alkalihalobacillus alcalophilus ATCC 27647 = CGMCC 1.3604]|uniref:Pseudouridine synthase n=1 Tax=Alkalihalobacillus alcalophilus ATCC 27647 = CGMCC 1.3604 TaxID=1218173 RepID=A0A094WLR3_ALKAL|nr:RluA family pseudouridine synthase [Alkalihalobacillus alcalophilus]KGA97761.1 pseudouridine synthase [Alkalihalobacillus alcalophilus ATCC 27647 = CGMCC 1.3604]MED1563131.1 RluA family pseudouridine synthase [Alkalihalobacillus alcalophilus]THG89247.1 RNA pseudouridine synthase [Alkalihalobacillus alcalophilus ATCC 27647 = CGMCC 1.3604]